jgi:hypothetical protein
LRLAEFVTICQNDRELKEFQNENAGETIDIYIPKVQTPEKKNDIRQMVIKAAEKGVPERFLAIAFQVSLDTVRRYLGKKK